MNPLADYSQSDVAQFFRGLGFKYSWDFCAKDNLKWHEIRDADGELMMQVQMGVPVSTVVQDLIDERDVYQKYFVGGWEDSIKSLADTVRKALKACPELMPSSGISPSADSPK